VKDTTILVVSNLGVGIEPTRRIETLATLSGDLDVLTHFEFATLSVNVELFIAS